MRQTRTEFMKIPNQDASLQEGSFLPALENVQYMQYTWLLRRCIPRFVCAPLLPSHFHTTLSTRIHISQSTDVQVRYIPFENDTDDKKFPVCTFTSFYALRNTAQTKFTITLVRPERNRARVLSRAACVSPPWRGSAPKRCSAGRFASSSTSAFVWIWLKKLKNRRKK